MNYMTKEAIMNRLQEHYEVASKQGELFGIFLQGSQNYINDKFCETSDVDSLAVYVPNATEICLGTDISKAEFILENEEHISRFDIRKAFQVFSKPGLNNYETLFTEYFIINEKYKSAYEKIVNIREEIVRTEEKGFLMSIMGISNRDFKNLQKPTVSQVWDIENLGYSRKLLSNVMRFNASAKAYAEGKAFSECLRSLDQEVIHEVRRTVLYELDEAIEIATKCNKETAEIARSYQSEGKKTEAIEKLNEVLIEILSSRF